MAQGGGWGPQQGGGQQSGGGAKAAIIVGAIVGGVFVLGILATLAVYGVRRYLENARMAAQGGDAGVRPTVPLAAKVPSKAHTHVPTGCELLIRLDVGQILANAAFQKHVVPALDDLDKSAETDPSGKEFKEFFSRAGIEPKTDVEEAIVCLVGLERPEPEQKFALVIGGDLRPDAIVPAFEAVEVPKPEISEFDGRKVATGRDKSGDPVIVGQAGDGAIVFASDRALFESAVKGSTAFQTEYALPVDVEASAVVSRAFIDEAAKKGGGAANPLSRDLAAMNKVVGTITLANPNAVLRMTMATPRDAVRFNQTLVGLLLPGFKAQVGREKSQVGEIEALKNAKSRVDGSDVVVEMPWTQQGIEQAAQRLAEELRKAKSKGVTL